MALLPLVSLCTGGGALDIGLARALPHRLQPVLYVEREAFACAYLAEAFSKGWLAEAPVWSDLTTFPEERLKLLAGLDNLVLTAGFPCQPWSTAGKRKKRDDERWIWEGIARWVRTLRPSIIALENVPGITRGGLEEILATLAAEGYVAAWDCVRASEAGAPHRRTRWFLLALLPDAVGLLVRDEPGRRRGHDREGPAVARDVGSPVADSDGRGQQELAQGHVQPGPGHRGQPRSDLVGCDVFPPPPDHPEWERVERERPDLLPSTELAVRGVADGVVVADANRVDLLRLLGNGVVPQQAELAFRLLLQELIAIQLKSFKTPRDVARSGSFAPRR